MLPYTFTPPPSPFLSFRWLTIIQTQIFNGKQFKRIQVSAKDVIKPFVALMILNVTVLTTWTIMNPLTWHRDVLGYIDEYGRQIESIGRCQADMKEWTPYIAALFTTNFTIIIIANYQAYRARHIDTEYSESHYINIIMVSFLHSCLIGLPVLYIMADQPVANFFTKAIMIFLLCMSMLLLMFVPKMYYLRKYLEEKAKKEKLKLERTEAAKYTMNRKEENSTNISASAIPPPHYEASVRIPSDHMTLKTREMAEENSNEDDVANIDSPIVVRFESKKGVEPDLERPMNLFQHVQDHGEHRPGVLNSPAIAFNGIKDDDGGGNNGEEKIDVDEEAAIIQAKGQSLRTGLDADDFTCAATESSMNGIKCITSPGVRDCCDMFQVLFIELQKVLKLLSPVSQQNLLPLLIVKKTTCETIHYLFQEQK